MQHIQFSEKGSRITNEDCCNVVEIPGKRTLFVVCDGMGGHSFGVVASKTACEVFSDYWKENVDLPDSVGKIEAAARQASAVIDEKSGMSQMGTTLVMASIEGNKAHIAHAGDSRCYVIDIKGNVKYRTIDHVGYNSCINRAFFTRQPESAIPEVRVVELQPFDRILFCTDGLYRAVEEEALLHILQCAKDVEQVGEKYRALCREKADDNYTAIVVEIE